MTQNAHAASLEYRLIKRVMIGLLLITGGGAVAGFGFLYWQGAKTADQSGEYVALGSSFAAGIGLGQRAPDSPIHCFRTAGGYPSLVAQKTGLRLVDMSCSGSTTKHILSGGQLLLGPQLAAIGPATKLVTITSGGNDVGYIGDLMAASGQMGRLGAWWAGPPQPVKARPFAKVSQNFEKVVAHIRKVAPNAKVVIVSYPENTLRGENEHEERSRNERTVLHQYPIFSKQYCETRCKDTSLQGKTKSGDVGQTKALSLSSNLA